MSNSFEHHSCSSGKAANGIYSVRNACIGSIRDALPAGTRQASAATTSSDADTFGIFRPLSRTREANEVSESNKAKFVGAIEFTPVARCQNDMNSL